MARPALSREDGIKLGRLPNYTANNVQAGDKLPGAIKLCFEVGQMVNEKAMKRVNGRQSSDRTVEIAQNVMNEICCRIWRLGFRPETIEQISGRHIEAVVRDYWACGASPKHFASMYTTLNKFDDWIGKPGLVKDKRLYLPEVPLEEFRAKQVATTSKSWNQNGIDVEQKFKEADALDMRFGLMLRMCVAFGLRRSEVLQIKPWQDDRIHSLEIRAGVAKGGRPRFITIETQYQRDLLDLVKSKIKQSQFLGWPAKYNSDIDLLKFNKQLYQRLMQKIGITKATAGITGHGLRAQYAEQTSLLKGWVPATLGGTKGQMPKDDEEVIRLQISENLGHSRISVTGAYFGSTTQKIQNSRGIEIAKLQLPAGSVASIYANPPPRANTDGVYPRLQARTRARTDIILVLDLFENGIATQSKECKILLTEGLIQLETSEGVFAFDADTHQSVLEKIGIVLRKFGLL